MRYPLCHRTVTVYHRENGIVSRRVAENCFYRWEDVCKQDGQGVTFARSCLLIQPGELPVFPGDRIFDGIGPEAVDWESFLPENVPGLSVVAYAAPRYFAGQICHYEAGTR